MFVGNRYSEVTFLVSELIDKIKEAEESAKAKIKESQVESDRVIREAREKASTIIEEAKKQAAESKKLFMKNAEGEAAQMVAQLKEFNNVEREKIRKMAEGNKAKVASFITGRVIG